MSDIIRGFRITNIPYRKSPAAENPYRLPSYKTEAPTQVPEPVIEGVPPLNKPREDVRKRTTNT